MFWASHTRLHVPGFGYWSLGTRVLTKGLGFCHSGFSVLETGKVTELWTQNEVLNFDFWNPGVLGLEYWGLDIGFGLVGLASGVLNSGS